MNPPDDHASVPWLRLGNRWINPTRVDSIWDLPDEVVIDLDAADESTGRPLTLDAKDPDERAAVLAWADAVPWLWNVGHVWLNSRAIAVIEEDSAEGAVYVDFRHRSTEYLYEAERDAFWARWEAEFGPRGNP
jgi:hypothetical protein